MDTPAASDPKTHAALLDLVTGRRTIHLFRPEPVPRQVLHEALAAAVWAPNHRATEPWRFYLLGPSTADAVVDLNARLVARKRGPEAGEAKRKRWACMPGWLLVTSERSPDPVVEQENYAAVCCAVQNLALVLWSRGVGTKWGTGPVTRDPELARIVGFDPDREQVVGLFWYGLPESVPAQVRRPLDEVLRELP